MERQKNRNGLGSSRDGSSGENDDLMRFLQNMMKNQQKQVELLRQGLLISPREQRSGNVSNFRRLQLVVFSRIEKLLDVEQWLIDTKDLLKATQIPNENQVKVVKIQLKDVSKTWWLAEKSSWRSSSLWTSSRRVFMRDSSLLRHKRR